MTHLRQGYGGQAPPALKPGALMPLLLVGALMTASVGIQVVRDRGWQPYQPSSPLLWVQSGALLERLALSYDNLVADLYWMRAVVYYGENKLKKDAANYEGLYPLLDMTTTLDPHFRVAYRFGAVFLSEAYPSGPGRPDQAIELLQRGIEKDFGRWEYFHDIGFVYYWTVKDYTRAAEWFLKGADRPDGAEWLRPLAATMLASGGDRATARQLWSQMRNSDMEFIRTQAELRLVQIDAMEQIAQLTPILERFIARERRVPRSWQELAVVERLNRVPVDPTGVPFVFDPKVGYIDVAQTSRLFPLPPESRQYVGVPR